MATDFERFWTDPLSVPPARLVDVGQAILEDGVPALPAHDFERPDRAAAMRADAADTALVGSPLADRALPVSAVRSISDRPDKHRVAAAGPPVVASHSHACRV